jgi:WD40 repeat protein
VAEFDGRWVVAVGGERGAVQVREIDTGEVIAEFGPSMPVRAVALAQAEDRLYLAIAHKDGIAHPQGEVGRIAVLDAVSGQPRHPGILVYGEINDVALVPMGGNLVVAAAATDLAGTWDALSGAPMSSVRHDGQRVSSVALATIGGRRLLATGGHDRTARIWDADHGQSMGPPLPHPAPVERVAFGEVDGRTMLVTGGLDGSARLWDPLRASGARVAVEGWFASLAMDSDVIVAGSEDGSVRLWELASGNAYRLALGPAPDQPTYRGGVNVRLAGAYPRFLLEQRPNRVAIWDLSTPWAPVLVEQSEIGGMRSVDVHAAGDVPLLATLDDADQVMVRDLVAGRIFFVTPIPGANSIRFIDAPDHPLLAVGVGLPVAVDRTLHLPEIESGQHVGDPVLQPWPLHAAVGSLDSALILAAPAADSLRLSDLRTAALTIPPVEMPYITAGVAWGRVGDRDVVVTAHAATVRVWNPRTGRKITELPFGTNIGAMSVLQTEDDDFGWP